MKFELAPEILERIQYILSKIRMPHIQEDLVYCIKSWGTSSRAIARIYSYPRAFQVALNTPPKYVIEVISERFFKLPKEHQDRVLIHELMHIPKTFSGSLVPHKCFGKRRICDKTVEVIYKQFSESEHA